MAMIGISAIGFLLSDGEKRRVRWIRAMRRCLLRMNGIIRYEQPELPALLTSVTVSPAWGTPEPEGCDGTGVIYGTSGVGVGVT